MKKVFSWMRRHWIITGLLAFFLLTVAVWDEEAYMNELSEKDPHLAAKLIKEKAEAKEQALYEQYKSEIDAMNCGKIMAQWDALNARMIELDDWRRAGMDEHGKRKREALDKGVTDDAIWAEIDDLHKTIQENYEQEKAEVEAEYLPRLVLNMAANEKGCRRY